MNKNNSYFYLKDFFTPIRGKRLTKNNRVNGTIPFVTAGKFNNGISEYISNDVQLFENKLTIDMFCNCFYQKYKFACDDNILVLNEKEKINDACKIYLSKIISLDNYRYQYGRQYRLGDFYGHKIKLPITSDGEPDWQFMEDYIKSLNIELPVTNNNLSNEKFKLDINKFEYFELSSLFDIETGTDLIYQEQEVGKYPVVGHNETNNGITCYIKKLPHRKLYNHNKTISLGDRGCFVAYVQPHDFYIGTRVKALISKSPSANIWNLQFISTIINRERFKYNYGRNATDKIPKIKIKLPITSNGNPDWQFMEDYIKSLPYGDCL